MPILSFITQTTARISSKRTNAINEQKAFIAFSKVIQQT